MGHRWRGLGSDYHEPPEHTSPTYLAFELGSSMSGLCEYRWWDIENVYRYRNDNLARMGFRSYRAYLKERSLAVDSFACIERQTHL